MTDCVVRKEKNMKILKEGKAHKHMAWFVTCDTCESDLRILEGDPLSTEDVGYQCDRRQYFIRYICPVCGSKKVAYTASAFGEAANAEYKEIILEKEDREEMEAWNDIRNLRTEEQMRWINNRYAP